MASYDLVVSASSSDVRSETMLGLMESPPQKVLHLSYSNAVPGSMIASRLERSVSQLRDMPVEVEQVQVLSENPIGMWQAFRSSFDQIALEFGRPIRVLVDLTVIPRYVTLGLLRMVAENIGCEYVDYFYCEANYNTDDRAEDGGFYVEGRWRSFSVPGVLGKRSPQLDDALIVLLGLDGDDTYRYVQSTEPSYVAAVLADPAVEDGLVQICEDQNRYLLGDWVGDRLVRIGACDAAGACDGVIRLVSDASSGGRRWNWSVLPVGTKPHALGAAVACVELGFPMLVYRAPEAHRAPGGEIGEYVHLFRVANLSVPKVLARHDQLSSA